MSDRRHPDHTRSTQERTEQTQRLRQPYPSYTDPAYSGQSFYPPPNYGSPPDPNSTHPTEKLPQYWLQGQPPPDQSPQEPEPRATESATLALDRRGRGGGSGYRIGHRPGDRQRHGQKANGGTRTARDAEFAAAGAEDIAITVGERTRTGHH